MSRINLVLLLLLFCNQLYAEVISKPDSLGRGAYVIRVSVDLSVSPDSAFDAMTGDISGWWDHSFSDKPKALYIEPKPGGHFMEIFDDAGNGCQHATVIYCDRGKMLRLEGPFGFSGRAVTNVLTWKYEAIEQGCRLTAETHLMGEVNDNIAGRVDKVTEHFLVERLKPFVEGTLKDSRDK